MNLNKYGMPKFSNKYRMCGLFFSWTVEELGGDGNINIRICFRFNDPQSRFSKVSPFLLISVTKSA